VGREPEGTCLKSLFEEKSHRRTRSSGGAGKKGVAVTALLGIHYYLKDWAAGPVLSENAPLSEDLFPQDPGRGRNLELAKKGKWPARKERSGSVAPPPVRKAALAPQERRSSWVPGSPFFWRGELEKKINAPSLKGILNGGLGCHDRVFQYQRGDL